MAAGACALPFAELLRPSPSRAADAVAKRIIFFYFPDGVAGPSQDGQPSLWHATGSEHVFSLPTQLEPLEPFRDECVFINGLSMGPTDNGSHPGGAKKLLTATDGGNGVSIDQVLAKTVGADAPWQHLYLGAMANQGGASGDKHISYPSPGQSITPEDDPRAAFELLFGGFTPPSDPGETPAAPEPDPIQVSVIDGILGDMGRLQKQLGALEKQKLDLHLEALREVEKRIKDPGGALAPTASCEDPTSAAPSLEDEWLSDPARFPDILRAQIDVMVLAMACGLTRVGTLQCSQHTSELIMSRFPGTEMYDPSFDMRSHQASHYGPSHDWNKKEFAAFVQQRRYWVGELAYLLGELAARPEGDGTMLDHSIVVLCTEVCDGNTHLHDDMPFVVAGKAGGRISTGRKLEAGGARHGSLYVSLAQAMGHDLASFGDAGSGPLAGLLS